VIETRPDGLHSEEWYIDGHLHREDGPAVIITSPGGYRREEWWIHGQQVEAP